MLHTAELDMANTEAPSDIDAFLTNAAWAICSTYHQYLKPPQEQQFLVMTCRLTSASLLTGTKLENTGSTRQTLTWPMKIAHFLNGTTKLVTKYFLEKMVSSTNQRVGMNVILGLASQSIWMEQSGFKVEQSHNNSTLRESSLSLKMKHKNIIYYQLSLSPRQTPTF